MSCIRLQTFIDAPVERVFDLSLSIDLHTQSMGHTGEKAVAGVTSGLIGLHETVTWQARHLFRNRTMTVAITALHRPLNFTDEQVKGDFKRWKHIHKFSVAGGGTLMEDEVEMEAPFGIAGRLLTAVFLKRYMTGLLLRRNRVLKAAAESNEWKIILKQEQS